MKPMKLVMSAFGSYGGIEEIDFQKVDRGLFLITGDTGAGKTTVFDAITYALFDETSGGRRDGDMMRSQFAEESTPTFVEYTFSYNGEQYMVRRNPNYRRISKRKNKEGEYTYTTELAAVELTMPDGTVFPGKGRETNEKIKEILGVDINQFTQISMIAQGDFLKLLHAPSKERKEIFTRIFDTKIYWQIQNRLKEQSKDCGNRLSDNQNLIRHELSGIRCPEEELQQEWEQMSEKPETGKTEIFDFLRRMEDYFGEREKELAVREKERTAVLDQVKVQLASARETNQQFDRKKETEASIRLLEQMQTELGQQLSEKAEQKKQLEQVAAERLPGLDQQLAEGRNLLPKYQLLGQRRTETEQRKKAGDQAKKELEEAGKQEQQLKQAQEELQKSQRELQPQVEQLPEIQQQERNCRQRKDEIQELCKLESRTLQLEKELKISGKQVADALAEFEKKSHVYERYNHIFIEEQAGILAEGLTEGSPCPVCGSTHHPRKAELSGEAVTQKQVEEAKRHREQAQEKLEREKELFLKQKERYEGERQVVRNNCQRLFGGDFGELLSGNRQEILCGEDKLSGEDNLSEGEDNLSKGETGDLPSGGRSLSEALQKLLQECGSRLNELTIKREQLENKQMQYQKQGSRLEEIVQQLGQLWSKKEQLQSRAYEANLAYEKAAQSLKELQETLTYSSRDALEQNLKQLAREKQKLEEGQKSLLEILQTLRQQSARNEGSLEEQKKNLELLNTALKGKQPVDISEFEQKEQELISQQEAATELKVSLLSGRDRISRGRKNLEKLYAEREKLKAEYGMVDTLSRTANGGLRQQARLDLQTYVQRRYFKHIIGEANRRLIKMSGGCFILQCRELEQLARQGEAGLDLDVYDMVTDQVRDVKTLSGGESFLAALSMALGMADVIQKNAGKVHLDTMFIDEGFGSLDDEARGKAIQILQELAGDTRLVGIISHVTELKEQMDRKLVITKGDKGSHAAWQMEN